MGTLRPAVLTLLRAVVMPSTTLVLENTAPRQQLAGAGAVGCQRRRPAELLVPERAALAGCSEEHEGMGVGDVGHLSSGAACGAGIRAGYRALAARAGAAGDAPPRARRGCR